MLRFAALLELVHTRNLWLSLLIGACAARESAPAAAVPGAGGECPVAPACAPQVDAPRALGEQEVARQAHALLEAYDRADEPAFGALAAEGFALDEDGDLVDREALLAQLRGRSAKGSPPVARDWQSEQVRVAADVAVFTAEAVEHFPASGTRPEKTVTGSNTIVFAHSGGALRPVYWRWQLSGPEVARQAWNTVFRGPREHREQPNQLLVDSVRGRPPGAALDVACGSGRNALQLASLGWKVTGVDISDVALRLAGEQAARRKLKLELLDADIATWDFGRERWDLVALVYAGPAMTPEILQKVQHSLRAGGLVVLEWFAPAPGVKRGQDASLRARLGELFGPGAGFEILRDEVVEDLPDWGWSKTPLLRFVARRR